MENISIVGIGVISNLGNDIKTIWEKLMINDELDLSPGVINFNLSLIQNIKKKRDHYSEMALYVSKMAIDDSKINIENLDKRRIGTIFTTGYGPIVSSLKFSESVMTKDYEFCSPALFANTVNNSCVGHVCMAFGFKGVSTVFMGSDNIMYSQFHLNKPFTDYILSGAVEEYCEDLYDTFKINESSKGVYVKEGAVSFFLQKSSSVINSYCEIVDNFCVNIGNYPLTDSIEEGEVLTKIKNLMSELISRYKIDVYFSSCNGSHFDELELEAAHLSLAGNIPFVNNVKKILGETLGASFNMNIMVSALCLKNGYLPLRLDESQRSISCAMVSGYDMCGNYMISILTANKREIGN